MTSTMFDVKIDRADPTPLHDQVAAQIRRAIAEGEAAPGQRLPPAKDFAAVMGVFLASVAISSSMWALAFSSAARAPLTLSICWKICSSRKWLPVVSCSRIDSCCSSERC